MRPNRAMSVSTRFTDTMAKMEGGVKIEQVTVTELKDNTYYAMVHMADLKGNPKHVDARPSDAIALALKTKARIKVAKQVMDSASITGEPITKSKVDLVAQLNQQLKDAIEIENNEEAAKIRDQLRSLERKTGSDDADVKDESSSSST